ncbi:hypothetical protein P153DRAFT_297919 [Dothidotthia symphoricarpi CBS 119687]|uniref:Uncharacterized protein n=1 Tax=Dothidotthia symphoricarpi CBS 119687 TaxID=1392245 RepID=A0A6A6A3C6_9PLEO|nr:uncharacterized protein P153DRAFT_297919 [Dothidotthia symphoricarpi CBS 119687]KAF2126379.1 hypothetical protein P153DRAFT_297919 [Dothidotthia symphoricarpi CBS 119687]
MRSFYSLALLAAPFFSLAVAEDAGQANTIYANAQEAFHDLLSVIPEESLQAALTSLGKFKEGVFESHHRGVEHVHNSNPALATKLIVAAVQDLRRRQVNNGTAPAQTSATPEQSTQAAQSRQESQAAQTTTARTTTTTDRVVLLPVEVTTTNTLGSTVVQTTEILSQVTAQVAVTVTMTNSQGATVTAVESKPAVIVTTTNSVGSTVTETSTANFAPTVGEVMTSTDSSGSTFLTTYTPGGGKISSVKLITTTGSDGQIGTITSFAYIDATATGAQAGDGAEQTPTTARPGLQSGAARKNSAFEYAVVGGLGGAFALFV